MNSVDDVVIRISHLKKKYRLGMIGGSTLTEEIQGWIAKKRGKENPNAKIGSVSNEEIGKEFWALNDVNLEVHKGEALGIIGINGAGKSTLLKILSRVTAPSEGRVEIKGRITSMLEVGTGFHGELTGRENIYMNGAILGMSKEEVDSKIDAIIEFSECGKFIDTPVKRYSSGMYVKLAFAVAAHLDSDIMIMDEVLAVGDAKFQEKCLGKMENAAEKEGKTVLYVSHNMSTIKKLCTRCIVLSHGEIVYDGNVEDAISVYMNYNMDKDFPVYYDMSDAKRPTVDDGYNIRMESVRLLGKEKAIYRQDEPVIIEVIWRANMFSEKGLRLITTFHYADTSFDGMAESKMFAEECVGGKCYKARFSIDISNLIAGVHYFGIGIFSINMCDMYTMHDQSCKYVWIKVLEDDEKGLTWERQFWGNIRLPRIEILQEGTLTERQEKT